ncbi:bifunctional salicylyl-CoA 5-hydroxylase/oxidoreductase [Nannocystis radixulma]|uniref:Bifunctional salicylyl-CoA 5-hydroxylase/oxidoreductase n=1 Tax=Nannocystis radixulma TaxID=2995305 RepID=A0ABT5BGD5_9BACT|nr:bifunctional salicylyl-CoA 5-hydroxylase/oxidoreductase [Nannocystis radixulma]MDC0673168.1 bifunctional salicylyl-CoA 5-hydroxylase/oxidoreductase [Nannocystis radixulma]
MKIAVLGGGPAGLYFSVLVKKARPDCEVVVVERNRRRDTFGWGVVFSDGTLGNFRRADPETYAAITDSFIHWDDIDTCFKGQVVRSGGHGFCGIARVRLLEILQDRALGLGVSIEFETEHEGLQSPATRGADLVVAADGINSKVRSQLAEVFAPTIAEGKAKYIWLGTTKKLTAFTFYVRENHHGLFVVHAYPFDRENSTFIVETDTDTWRRAGLDAMSTEESVAYCERLFAEELGGHRLMSNKSSWLSFREVKCARWWSGNVVLIGDAAHTAHFSIGSGTKLAMEDSIALCEALQRESSVPAALQAYHEARWLEVAKLQRAAKVSQTWFEEVRRYKDLDPQQFVLSMMTRSKRVTYENLRVRDRAYVGGLDRWFAGQSGCEAHEPAPPPMFTPLRLRELTLQNRVVVSAMCQYSAADGLPDEWHLVHLGGCAVGGAGLVMTEMTNVAPEGRISPGCTGIWSPAHAAAWRRVVDFVHAHSTAKIGIQLGHAGRKGSAAHPWEGADSGLQEGGWELLGPSPVAYAPGFAVPKEMTPADMAAVVEQFRGAAQLAEEAGFDLVEVHMAHGYLLASFISPLTNLRRDEYGGSLANRMRFPLQVLDAVRAAVPAHKPVSVRISATDWIPDGLDEEDAVEIACMLKAHGCDLVDVSAGQTTPESRPEIYGRMFQTHLSDRIRHEAGVTTMAVGAIQDWDQVNTIIASGRADLCALARPHLLDPHFTLRAAAEQNYRGPGVTWPPQYLPARPRG